MSATKWILGALGFVMGGPIGAIVGVVMGALFDGITGMSVYSSPNEWPLFQRSESSCDRRGYTNNYLGVNCLCDEGRW